MYVFLIIIFLIMFAVVSSFTFGPEPAVPKSQGLGCLFIILFTIIAAIYTMIVDPG